LRKEPIELSEQMTNDQGPVTISQSKIQNPKSKIAQISEWVQNLKIPLTVLLCCLAVLRLIIKILLLSGSERTESFIGYYAASMVLVQGRLGPQVYDNAWFIAWVQQLSGQPVSEIFAPSLPTVSLVALPLAFFSLQQAHAIWLWFSFFVLLASLALLLFGCELGLTEAPSLSLKIAFLAFALFFQPTLANFEVSQSIIFFFGLFTLALFGLTGGRQSLGGLALGLAFILKTTGVTLWFLLLLRRRWSALGWGIAMMIAIAGLSLPWIGLATWQAYLEAILKVTDSPTKAVTAYQTTAGFLTHLFQFDPTWNPYPLYHWPALANRLTWLITGTTLALTLWLGRKTVVPISLLFAALLPLSIILLPVAEEHHFVILLISIFILIADLLPALPFPGTDWSLLTLALLLMALPFPYENPTLSQGWLALLAYPRLYGGWLLWLVALRRMRIKGTLLTVISTLRGEIPQEAH
jgi:hypothetical protein